MIPAAHRRSAARSLAAVLVVGAVLLVGAAVGLYRAWTDRTAAHAEEHWRGRLAAMAEDRAAVVDAWLHERRADAAMAASGLSALGILAPRSRPAPAESSSIGSGRRATELLRSIATHYGYSEAWVVSAGRASRVLAQVGQAAPPVEPLRCATGDRPDAFVGFVDMGGGPRLAVAAPVWPGEPGRGHPIGAVMLARDPVDDVFPFLQHEPVPTRSGETLLVRRDGNDIVYLSPLRHGVGEPGLVRRPIVAGLAAGVPFTPRDAVGALRDYRRTRVLAAGMTLREARGWGLVVKIDREEALQAHLSESRRAALGVAALLVALVGVGFGLSRHQAASARVALARSEAGFARFVEHAADAVLFLRPDGRILRANRRAAELYGYSPDDLLTRRFHDLYPREGRAAVTAQLADVRRRGELVFEAEHVSSEGRPLAVEVACRFVEEGDGAFVSIVRDVRERRAAERRIASLNRTLRTLTAVNQLMVREADRERFLHEACRVLVESGGFRMAWIGLRDPQTDWIVPAAWAGHEDGYLSETCFSADESTPRGLGPTGEALRLGRSAVVADVDGLPSSDPWRDAQLRRGYRSFVVCPIRSRESVTGCVALYAGEPEVFVPEVVALVEELADDVGFALDVSDARRERDEAAARLAESRDFLQTLVDSSSAAIFTIGVDGRVGATWNRAAERLFGWSASEVVGTALPIVDEAHQGEYRAIIGRVLAGERIAEVEVRRLRRDGSPIDLSVAASPLRGSRGEVTGVLAVALDVTARRATEAALRESESRFRRLAERVPDVIFRYRFLPEPRVEYVSPAAADLGYAPEEWYAEPTLLTRIIHPEDRPLLERVARGDVADGEAIVIRWTRRDGAILWSEIRVALVRGEDGRVCAVEGISRDITERVRQERVLRQLSAAVEQSPAAIVITDTAGTIEYVNPAFTRQSGYSREEAVGRNSRILRSGHHSPEFYAAMYAALGRGEVFHAEMLNRRKDGTLYWEHASLSPVVDAGGRATHYLAVKEDITERKSAEKALRRTQEVLLQSHKLEAIGRLAGGISHDFNNLLGVIIGHGEMAEATLREEDAVRARVSQILDAARRAAQLTRQLLAFSRRQVLEPRVVDLNAVVSGMEDLLRRLIGEDVDLVVDLAPELGRVQVDPGQMSQVMMNLAVNARDAMSSGGTLRISTSDVVLDEAQVVGREPMPPGRYVQVLVSDDGSGMDEAVRAHAFEPFYTTKQEGAGTGLGLATVYGIVKQSGGFIWLESAPGRGSTFTIQLPRVDEPADATVAAAPARSAPAGSETVLLVEDQGGLRDLLREMLEEAGYRVLDAASGHDALERCAAHGGPIDLLITDVVMPGMNGRELLERVRETRPLIRTIFISGYTNDIIVRKGAHLDDARLKGVRLLEKPFGREALLDAIRDALAASGGA